jgi:hypothetical protein
VQQRGRKPGRVPQYRFDHRQRDEFDALVEYVDEVVEYVGHS